MINESAIESLGEQEERVNNHTPIVPTPTREEFLTDCVLWFHSRIEHEFSKSEPNLNDVLHFKELIKKYEYELTQLQSKKN